MTSRPSERIRAARLPPHWAASYGRRPPPDSVPATLVGPAERSRTLHVLAGPESLPSIVEGGGCSVVFSGRLHGSRNVAGGKSDAELVLEAYLRRGEACLSDLRGMFVLLLHDARDDTLTAARDPLGYYPLFFSEQDDRVLISMSQEVLLELGVVKDVNRAAAAAWICQRWLDPRRTFFTGIARLLPGHRLRISGAGLSVHRYWTPFGHEREDTADFGAVYEEFDALLREAVARCLELGPAGISLSGGIDSTTIAVVAAEVSRQQGRPDPWAMSLRFPDPESDESTVQRAVAQAIGLPQGFASFSDACGDEGPLIETLSLAADLPMPPVVPWDLAFDALAFQAADRGCRVLLGGDGSGWLRADWALVGDLLRSLDFKSVKDMYEAERRYYRFSRWSAMKTFLWRSGVRQLVRQTAGAALVRLGADPVLGRLRRDRLLRSIPAWIAPDPDLRRELVDGWSAMLPQPRTKDFHRRSRAESLDAPYMTIPMDWYRDRSRQLGVELLDPFQDPDLVEFLCAIPPKHLFAGGRVKALARETVRRRIPEFDAKILRGVYVEELFESMLVEDGARAFELIDGMRTLSDLGIIDRDPLEKALQRGIFTAEVRYSEAWQALAVEAWLGGRMRGQSLTLRSPLG